MLYTSRRVYRAKAPLQVLIGFSPTEPLKLAVTATPKLAEAILSGMAIAKDTNGQWVKALDADATIAKKSIFIALQDQDDLAVQSSGKLVGLDCSDSYEVQTGYFKTLSSGAYAYDDQLSVGTGGVFAKAASGDYVRAKITLAGAETNGTINIGGVTPCATDNTVIQMKTVAPYIMA